MSLRTASAPSDAVALETSEVRIAHNVGTSHSSAKKVRTTRVTILKARGSVCRPEPLRRAGGAAAEMPLLVANVVVDMS